MTVKDITRKRLEWLVDPRKRPPESVDVGFGPNQWAEAMAEMAKETLDELDSYRGIKVETSLVSGDQIVWIDGIKYARELFRSWAETPVGEWLRIVRRDAGLLQVERVRLPEQTWQPIEIAPVPPYKGNGAYNAHWRCMLQNERREVYEGWAYWVPPRARTRKDEEYMSEPLLRWANRIGQCHPKYWQPLPLPFNEPLNEETTR